MIDEGTGEIIKRTSLIEMATAYAATIAELKAHCEAISALEDRLLAAFDNPSYKLRFRGGSHEQFEYREPKQMLDRLHREAWGVIVDRANICRILPNARRVELEQWLSTGRDKEGHPLPELTVENIAAMLEHNAGNLRQYISESIKEVYSELTPRGKEYGLGRYKTNQQWHIGKRIVLSGGTENWGSKCWRVGRWREQLLRNLDNIFHMLDGKGTVHTHYGPLIDAISKTPRSEGEVRTDYFIAKLFKNGNIHLEFTRPDLVDQFNLVATGNELRS